MDRMGGEGGTKKGRGVNSGGKEKSVGLRERAADGDTNPNDPDRSYIVGIWGWNDGCEYTQTEVGIERLEGARGKKGKKRKNTRKGKGQ